MPTQLPPISASGTVGKFVKINIAKNPPVTASACGRENNCRKNSLGKFVSLLERVTSKPAANEIKNAGTWLTSPSPIVSFVKISAAWVNDMPPCAMPITKPPMMLISVIKMAAMASPRTNLLAPSIAPKKSACLRDFLAATLGFHFVDAAGI